jgi:hypothetical protein
MATSVVYASLFAGVLATMPALRTSVLAFDTAVADLSALASDPVELLFGVQLGGGTDIARALRHARSLVIEPARTVVVLVSDLYEGGSRAPMVAEAAALVQSGVTVLSLVALSDDGAPAFDYATATEFAALGIASFASTPDAFVDLFAAALAGDDLAAVAAHHDIAPAAPLV